MRGGHHRALSSGLVVPTAALVAVGLGLTVLAGPIFDITSRAALDLILRTPYLVAVLGPGGDTG
jgi:multicomponent Na+:H+ antiporter subunit D